MIEHGGGVCWWNRRLSELRRVTDRTSGREETDGVDTGVSRVGVGDKGREGRDGSSICRVSGGGSGSRVDGP